MLQPAAQIPPAALALPTSLANWHLAHASLDAGDAATATGLLDLSTWRPQLSAPQRGRPGFLMHGPDACLLGALCLHSLKGTSDEEADGRGFEDQGSFTVNEATGLDAGAAVVDLGSKIALQICAAKALCGQSAGSALERLAQLRALEIVKQGDAAPLLPGKGLLDSLVLITGQTDEPGSLSMICMRSSLS